jgi:hypothetical protein
VEVVEKLGGMLALGFRQGHKIQHKKTHRPSHKEGGRETPNTTRQKRHKGLNTLEEAREVA